MKATTNQLKNMTGTFIKEKGGKDKVTQKDFYDFWVDLYEKKKIGAG
jgi:hypothetical protein